MGFIKLTTALLSVLLATACFTACGGAPTPEREPVQSAGTSGEAAAVPDLPQGALRALRGVYGAQPETELYFGELFMANDQNYRTVIDMQQAKQRFLCTKPDCPHGVPTCEALYETGAEALHVWAVTQDDMLLWLDGGETKPNTIYKTDAQGGNRQPLFTLDGEIIEYSRMRDSTQTDGTGTVLSPRLADGAALFADDTALYLQVRVTQSMPGVFPGYAAHSEIWRVELATGEHTVLFRGEPDTESIGSTDFDWLVGCTENALLLDVAHAPTMEELEAAYPQQPTLRHSVVELPASGTPDNTPLTVLYEYEENGFSNHVISNNMLYLLNSETGRIDAVDLISGASRTLVETLPAEGSAFLKLCPDGTPMVDLISQETFDVQSYAINKESGALTPATLQYLHNGHLQAVQICAQYKEDFLVIYEDKKQPVNSVGTDGQPYNFDSYLPQYALISKQDYYAGNPNYREIEMLSQ